MAKIETPAEKKTRKKRAPLAEGFKRYTLNPEQTAFVERLQSGLRPNLGFTPTFDQAMEYVFSSALKVLEALEAKAQQ